MPALQPQPQITTIEQYEAWYRVAAENGDPYSQYSLGYCYLYSKGVGEDNEQAVYWLECASKQNYASAQHLLGKCYENGWGVKIDIEKANVRIPQS